MYEQQIKNKQQNLITSETEHRTNNIIQLKNNTQQHKQLYNKLHVRKHWYQHQTTYKNKVRRKNNDINLDEGTQNTNIKSRMNLELENYG